MWTKIKLYSAIALGLFITALLSALKIKNNTIARQKKEIKVVTRRSEIAESQREFKAKVLAEEADQITREIENAKNKSLLDRVNRTVD